MSTVTAYITIGNSDDKLTQYEWSAFYGDVAMHVREHAHRVHGRWLSAASDPWQNACWCVEVEAYRVEPLKGALRRVAKGYRQDSIAWAVAPTVEFLSGGGEVAR